MSAKRKPTTGAQEGSSSSSGSIVAGAAKKPKHGAGASKASDGGRSGLCIDMAEVPNSDAAVISTAMDVEEVLDPATILNNYRLVIAGLVLSMQGALAITTRSGAQGQLHHSLYTPLASAAREMPQFEADLRRHCVRFDSATFDDDALAHLPEFASGLQKYLTRSLEGIVDVDDLVAARDARLTGMCSFRGLVETNLQLYNDALAYAAVLAEVNEAMCVVFCDKSELSICTEAFRPIHAKWRTVLDQTETAVLALVELEIVTRND